MEVIIKIPQAMREKEELHLVIFSCALIVEQIIHKSVQMYKIYEVSRYLFVTFSQNIIFINCSFSFFQSQFLRIKMIFVQRKTRTKPKSIYANIDNESVCVLSNLPKTREVDK
jgi:hypothetical protein